MKHSFNKEQEKARKTVQGKVLVLAGAGSGKTSVLTARIIHLIKDHNVEPEAILGLTFTNKAATQMRTRITKLTGKSIGSRVPLFTFHSFCLYVLKEEIHHLGYTNTFSLYDERDKLRIEEQVYEELSEMKQQINEETIRKGLMKVLKSYNAIDFDGLLELCVQLFKEFPAVRDKYQEIYKYVMIDEYQDTNPIQYELITLLTEKRGNLFVVGDDDQAIYGFRGAQVDHILSFPHDTVVKLEENFRSNQPILNIANSVIQKNSNRHDKVLHTKKMSQNFPRVFHAPTEAEEAESIIHRILYLRDHKNIAFNEMAILYRSNNLSRSFEIALMQASYKDEGKYTRGIPYEVVQGTSFYQRAEVKDLFSYLSVLYNTKDATALFRVLNYPKRGISAATVEAINKHAAREHITPLEALEDFDYLDISQQGKIGISIFLSILRKAHKAPTIKEKFQVIIKEINFAEVIKKEVKSEQAQIFKLDNIQTCVDMAETADKEGASLGDFINSANLDDHKHNLGKKSKGINLLTFHSAKGLEFKACFIVSLEDGIMPHEKSLEEGGIEEERRLFYVAITRAKEYLYLSMARKRLFRGKPMKRNACRFLFDIPKTLLEIEAFNNFQPLH